jgi:hypothetical protein
MNAGDFLNDVISGRPVNWPAAFESIAELQSIEPRAVGRHFEVTLTFVVRPRAFGTPSAEVAEEPVTIPDLVAQLGNDGAADADGQPATLRTRFNAEGGFVEG